MVPRTVLSCYATTEEANMIPVENRTEAALGAALVAVVAERPDYVYPDELKIAQKGGGFEPAKVCQYVINGDQPGCVFGAALMRMGATPDELRPLEFKGISTVLSLMRFEGPKTLSSHDWLGYAQRAREVQQEQDSGGTWGDALAEGWFGGHRQGREPGNVIAD